MTDVRDTPVLVVSFNRPDLTRAQIGRLRAIAPRRLYLASDGPRPGVEGEDARVEQVREAASLVDWDAEVHTLHRDQNVGCARGVSGAVTWFLQQEPAGIILEDDIVASPDFFRFATEMLQRYADDARVWSIGGLSLDPPAWRDAQRESYRFTAIAHYWGWATWARAWDAFDLDLDDWRARFGFDAAADRHRFTAPTRAYLRHRFESVATGRIDAWTPAWMVRSLAADGVHVKPLRTLTRNVAITQDATHPGYEHPYLRDPEPLHWPLVHPASVVADPAADRALMRGYYECTWPGLARKAARKARRTVQPASA